MKIIDLSFYFLKKTFLTKKFLSKIFTGGERRDRNKVVFNGETEIISICANNGVQLPRLNIVVLKGLVEIASDQEVPGSNLTFFNRK